MPYPTELSAADWTTLEQLISGSVPPTAQMIAVGYDAEGLALGNLFPIPPSPVPIPTPVPCAKMTRPQGSAVCKTMITAKGAKSAHKGALAAFSWQALLQLIEEVLAALTPILPAS